VGWIVLGVLALVGVLLIGRVVGLYDGLVRRRNQVDNAWGQTDDAVGEEQRPVRVRF
jgi:hypothetical protein